MIEWRKKGAPPVLRRHGQSAAIIEVPTKGHGRHAGVVRGGAFEATLPSAAPSRRWTSARRPSQLAG